MKKFYAIALAGIALSFTQPLWAQYTATNSGNWSNPATWGPGSKPPVICPACTITINAGVVVTLDVSTTFTSGTVLNIGSDATSPSALVIPPSGGTSIATGFNILLDLTSPSSKIVLVNKFSALAAISSGVYDGVFTDIANGTILIKTVGNLNGPSLFFQGSPNFFNPNPPPASSSLEGPVTLSSNGTLPIVLAHFDAVLSGKEVNLSWATLVEINGDHFGIERSTDGMHWETLGTVAAVGNSEILTNYSYTDHYPISGINYYRLQMVDRDGKYKYSPVKVVRGTLIEGYSVFPNPARDYVNVTLSAHAPDELTIRLITSFGQVLQESKFSHAAGTTVSLPVRSYPAGNYILSITARDGTNQASKVLITP